MILPERKDYINNLYSSIHINFSKQVIFTIITVFFYKGYITMWIHKILQSATINTSHDTP